MRLLPALSSCSPALSRARCSRHTDGSAKQATQEEMQKAQVPLAFRDQCAHLLIPLNECVRPRPPVQLVERGAHVLRVRAELATR